MDYTTKGENGEIIHHNDTHFSLKPLIAALEHYMKAYNESPKTTDADWAVLDNIWIKEVGAAQRQVPAHIAQEYCHPNRSFSDVIKNKGLLYASNPNNLKRQLGFYNWNTNNDDLWFTHESAESNSGLGFSLGILRHCSYGAMAIVAGEWWSGRSGVDWAAIKVIDEVRTRELKQSLHNLSQPSIAPPSHSPAV